MLRIPVAEGGLFDSRASLPIWEELMKIVDNGSGMGAALRRERERLLKPLVQERNGPLPGKASSLGVILRAILLEEPMFGPQICMDSDQPPRSLERLLHLRDRLRWYEGVILREVADCQNR